MFWRLSVLYIISAVFVGPLFAAQAPSPTDVISVMKKVANNYLDKHNTVTKCVWQHAAFLQGNMASFRSTLDVKYLNYTMWWGDSNRWITCNYPKVLTERGAANDMSCGQTYAEVYLLQGEVSNDTYIHSIHEVLDVLVNRSQIDDWWWVDAYFMAMGTFARIGYIMNDTKYHTKNYALFNDSSVRRGLWDLEDHLFYRDETYINKTTPSGQKVFWGRGNGWAIAGLARTMQFLSSSHPSYSVYKTHLQQMAAKLKTIQQSDGMWRASLLDAAQVPNPESTSTGGMLFGIAWGINSGILDREEYLPVVNSAWNGLTTLAIHEDGFLGYCQPVGGGPAPAKPSDTSDFCVGLFLLGASEMVKINSNA